MTHTNEGPRNILVAEDGADDSFFIKRAFSKVCGTDVVHVGDGEQCITYLSECISSPGTKPPPDLIMLDIKMPRIDGIEVLVWLSQQPALCNIPAVVMSGSVRDDDRVRSLAAGAKAYFVKPVGIEEIMAIVTECAAKWPEWSGGARQPQINGEPPI